MGAVDLDKTPDAMVLQLDRLSSEALSSIFAAIELSDAQDVHGRYEVLACGEVTFVRATTNGGLFHVDRKGVLLTGAPCDAYFLCLPLAGGTMLSQHGRDCALRPGDLGLLDAQNPYRIEVASGCDALWIRLPRRRLDWSPRALRLLRLLPARRVDGSSGLGLLVARSVRTLFEQMPLVPAPSRAVLAAVMIDLIGEATSVAALVEQPFRPTGRRTLDRARIFIERHLAEDDLSLARIAAGVGISQRYLSDLFASDGATTMRHVTLLRLEKCRDALARETWRPGIVTQIAFANGFVNLSSFKPAVQGGLRRPPARRDARRGPRPSDALTRAALPPVHSHLASTVKPRSPTAPMHRGEAR